MRLLLSSERSRQLFLKVVTDNHESLLLLLSAVSKKGIQLPWLLVLVIDDLSQLFRAFPEKLAEIGDLSADADNQCLVRWVKLMKYFPVEVEQYISCFHVTLMCFDSALRGK